MEKKYAIYKVTNKANGKVYIGKTVDFESRKWQHERCYEKEDCAFHRALQKYGKENFSWEVIDGADKDDEASVKESYWIKFYNSCIHFENSNGYNMNCGGVGGHNARPILQFDLNGEFIKEYRSCETAASENIISSGAVRDCANGKLKRAGKYIWKWKDDFDGNPVERYIRPESTRKRKVVQLDKDGFLVNIFESVSEASQRTGTRRTNISACLIGEAERANNFQWIYFENYDPAKDYKYKGHKIGNGIVQLDDDFNIINHFRNCAEAARYLGEPTKVHKQIHKALGTKKRCRGYYWRKYNDYLKMMGEKTEYTTSII